MVGREKEITMLQDCLNSPRPEFLAVYGRHRVGKTYLIKEFFQGQFAFYSTGIAHADTKGALRIFHESLCQYGSHETRVPKDWFEAFSRLRTVLSEPSVVRDYRTGKKVVFLDELPWMDTAKSTFKSALDFFWNSWGADQKDLMLIVCGSATSWIITNIIQDTGGFYNRITQKIHMLPFNLHESEALLHSNGIEYPVRQMIECYMIFGGIPYYLKYLKPQYSLAQNVDMLLFQENGPLHYEYDQLFRSLFKHSAHHVEILEELVKKGSGMTRTELLSKKQIPQGKELTKCLRELEECGFIRSYTDYTRTKSSCIYQLIDPFTLFHLTWLNEQSNSSWLEIIDQPRYYTWCGLAFERVCLIHTPQIKRALGITGISSQEYAWNSKKTAPGAQIDLLIDRKDDVINVCETKYTMDLYCLDASDERSLLHKIETFRKETGTRKALQLTMITLYGLKHPVHWHSVLHGITGKDLLQP